METRDLEAHLQRLDQTVLSLGNSITSLRSQAANLYSQADSHQDMASRMLSQASYEEDPDRISQIYSQANMYMNQAQGARNQAAQLEAEANARAEELRGYKAEYQYFLNEGQNHIAELQIAAQQLTGAAANRYGSKMIGVLQQTKQRIIYNQNLINGCVKRINWIDSIAGSGGDSYQKVLRR